MRGISFVFILISAIIFYLGYGIPYIHYVTTLLSLMFLLFAYKVYRYEKKSAKPTRRYALLLPLIYTIFNILTIIGHAQQYCDVETCPAMRSKIYALEVATIFLLLFFIFIALQAMGFVNVPGLAIIAQALAGMAMPFLVALIITTLALIPAHVVFESCTTVVNGETVQGCFINPCNLFTEGPPIWQIFGSFTGLADYCSSGGWGW